MKVSDLLAFLVCCDSDAEIVLHVTGAGGDLVAECENVRVREVLERGKAKVVEIGTSEGPRPA